MDQDTDIDFSASQRTPVFIWALRGGMLVCGATIGLILLSHPRVSEKIEIGANWFSATAKAPASQPQPPSQQPAVTRRDSDLTQLPAVTHTARQDQPATTQTATAPKPARVLAMPSNRVPVRRANTLPSN